MYSKDVAAAWLQSEMQYSFYFHSVEAETHIEKKSFSHNVDFNRMHFEVLTEIVINSIIFLDTTENHKWIWLIMQSH